MGPNIALIENIAYGNEELTTEDEESAMVLNIALIENIAYGNEELTTEDEESATEPSFSLMNNIAYAQEYTAEGEESALQESTSCTYENGQELAADEDEGSVMGSLP